jgi:hypothetical protein
MSVYPYAGQYIGLLRVFHGDREIDLELAHSHDDLHWKRTNPGKPFLPRGSSGSIDSGMVFSANSLVTVGDELWFYYGAFTGDHAAAEDKQSISISLAKLRRDGFVSLTAEETPGAIVTTPLVCDGNQLLINATAKQGSIQVELQDESGLPLPGFAFSDCDEFRDDSVSHVVGWTGMTKLDRYRDQTIRMAFRLKNARLFAFQLVQ